MVISEGDTFVFDLNSDNYRGGLDKQGINTLDILRSPLAYPDMGLSTVIPQTNTDANGGRIDPNQRNLHYRMRKQDKFTLNRALQRNLTSAFFQLRRIKNKLNLPDAALQRAAHSYRKALHLDLAKGRSIKGLIVASAYGACRELNLPKTLEEIAQSIDADPVFGGRCYRLLAKQLNWSSPRIGADTYVNQFANILGVRGSPFKRALEIISRVKESHIFLGKNPRAMAAAALYVACEFDGVHMPQAKLASATDVSIVSIRKRITDIRTVYRE